MSNLSKYNDINDDLTMEKIINLLKEQIPEFWKMRTIEDSNEAYVVYGDFAIWLANQINNKINIEAIKRSCELIEKLVESGNEEILNLVEISILEILVDELKNHKEAKKYFNKQVSDLLEKVYKRYY